MNFVPLESIAHIQLGKMLSPKSKTGKAAFPYLRNQNVQWHRFNLNDLATMDFSEREREKFKLRSGDLLICEGGEPGRCAVWKGQLDNCYYQKALHRVRPFSGVANSDFLALWIRHQAASGAFTDQNAKTTIAHLPLVRLSQLLVPTVDFRDQCAIALKISGQMAEVDQLLKSATAQLQDIKQLPTKLLAETFRY